jgi:alcohol dehydrogenase YqhD (iron-dependent ADH family)
LKHLNTVIETTQTLIASPDDEAARGEFAWAATLAQNGLILSGCAGFSYRIMQSSTLYPHFSTFRMGQGCPLLCPPG